MTTEDWDESYQRALAVSRINALADRLSEAGVDLRNKEWAAQDANHLRDIARNRVEEIQKEMAAAWERSQGLDSSQWLLARGVPTT